MWQRKQTIYLLLTAILLLTLQILPLAIYQDATTIAANSKVYGLPSELYCALIYNPNISEYVIGTVTLLALISIVVAIISFVNIFLFRNRKLQMRICRNAQLLLMLWGCLCTYIILSDGKSDIHLQFGICLPIVSLILLQLAYKGIKHDDDLVKSADRLR